MKPHIVLHMSTSIDGRLHPSRFTASPDGTPKDWSTIYERVHDDLAGDAWIVGRVTMAEMSKAAAHPPADASGAARPVHVADPEAKSFAVALDSAGKVHFDKGDVGGDHVVMLLGGGVTDAHLAELAGDGVSYIVAGGEAIDLAAALEALNAHFGIERLLLEGGAGINGAFLAAGLVDELSILVAPALDGAPDVQGIVAQDGGLKGKVALSLKAAEEVGHGVVHLRYTVAPEAPDR